MKRAIKGARFWISWMHYLLLNAFMCDSSWLLLLLFFSFSYLKNFQQKKYELYIHQWLKTEQINPEIVTVLTRTVVHIFLVMYVFICLYSGIYELLIVENWHLICSSWILIFEAECGIWISEELGEWTNSGTRQRECTRSRRHLFWIGSSRYTLRTTFWCFFNAFLEYLMLWGLCLSIFLWKITWFVLAGNQESEDPHSEAGQNALVTAPTMLPRGPYVYLPIIGIF